MIGSYHDDKTLVFKLDQNIRALKSRAWAQFWAWNLKAWAFTCCNFWTLPTWSHILMAASMDPGTAGLGLSFAAEVMWGDTTSILFVLLNTSAVIVEDNGSSASASVSASRSSASVSEPQIIKSVVTTWVYRHCCSILITTASAGALVENRIEPCDKKVSLRMFQRRWLSNEVDVFVDAVDGIVRYSLIVDTSGPPMQTTQTTPDTSNDVSTNIWRVSN